MFFGASDLDEPKGCAGERVPENVGVGKGAFGWAEMILEAYEGDLESYGTPW